MKLLRIALPSVALAALFIWFVPVVVSAQYYPNCNNIYPYTNTYPYNSYPYNYSYGNYPYGYNCQNNLYIYVQVNNYGGNYRSASDFTISVGGGNAYPATIPGSVNGV